MSDASPPTRATPSATLRTRVSGALLWSGLGQAIRQATTIAIVVLLARILGPEAIGLFAMLAVFVGLGEMLHEMGLGSALVHRPALDSRHTSSVFWLTLALGGAMGLAWIALVPALAHFYDEPAVGPLGWALAANFAVAPLRCVPHALLVRELRFRPIAVAEVVATLASGALALVLAWRGAGATALVAQLLARNALLAAILWSLARWRPRLRFDLAAVREVVGFGGPVTGFQVLTYCSTRLDHLVLGRVLGAATLGIYTKAFELMLLPLRQINAVVSRVMFPALSEIQDDPGRVKRVYLRGVSIIALVAAPLMLGGAVLAEPLVLGVLGRDWVEIIPLLRVFCLIGLAHSLGVTTGWLFMSQGATGLMLRWGLLAAVVRVGALAIGLRWGALGVAVAHLVLDYGLLLYPAFAMPGRLIGMSFGEVVRAVQAPIGCAAVMAAVVAAGAAGLPSTLPAWVTLVVLVPAGAATYLALIHGLRLDPYRELRRLLAHATTRLRPRSLELVS